jgi:NAD(P)H-flavin reductase
MSTASVPEPVGDAAAATPMLPRVAQVRARRRETGDTWSLAVDAGAMAFEPGQFNMLYAFGIGEIPVSLSGDPARPGLLIHTVRAVGAVSRAVTRLRPGDMLGLRGPYGTAWPVAENHGNDVVVIAGGLGLAPLRPAIYRLFAERERYGRIAVLYGTRSPADILFRRELERWRRRLDVAVEVTVDHADPLWHGNVGVVTKLVARAVFDADHTSAFVCGPEIMMRFAASALETAGVAPERIHVSLERNMKCAIGQCGHCQLGPSLVCRDGAVMRYDRVRPLLTLREL